MTQYPAQNQWESAPATAPPVVTWFKVYAAGMALVYLAVAAIGALFLLFAEDMAQPSPGYGSSASTDTTEIVIMGGIYLVMGLVFAVAFLVPFVLGRSKGTWIYSIVLICLGLTSVCCLPATIPLLLFWLKPEAKRWYGV